MEEMELFPQMATNTRVLVTVFNKELVSYSQKITQLLRSKNINTDLYPDPNDKLQKQLKYADEKKIPYAVIAGPDEAKKQTVTRKNLQTQKQETIPQEKLTEKFS